MPQICRCCAHPERATIDAELEAGASADAIAERYGLNRSSVRRHNVGHRGRAVTFRIPPTSRPTALAQVPPPTSQVGHETPSDPTAIAFDCTAELDRLFAQATAGPDRALQDWVRLTIEGLGHVYATARAIGDLGVAVRALRELRALLQFHAVVEPAKLRQHLGWHEPPAPPDPTSFLMAWLSAPLAPDPARTGADALSGLAGLAPELASGLMDDLETHALNAG